MRDLNSDRFCNAALKNVEGLTDWRPDNPFFVRSFAPFATADMIDLRNCLSIT